MAGIQTILTFNVSREVWAKSVSEPSTVAPPKWYSGDTRNILLQFIRDEPGNKASVVTDIVSVQAGVGTPGSAAITSATSGTPDANFYPITLPFPKSATDTHIAATAGNTLIEFRTTSADGDQRYQGQLILKKQILSGVDADPGAPDRPMGILEFGNIGMTKAGVAGELKEWISPDGTKRKIQYLGNDGLMHYDDQ